MARKNQDIPARQRALVQQELEGMFKGNAPTVYQVLEEVIRPITALGTRVLEIGCSSGHYYEVLEYSLTHNIDYTGVDYSEPMIEMAADYYPKVDFKLTDGAHLQFENERFEVAIFSCVLLHVPNYPEHIAEAVRAAKCFVVAHQTPICRSRPTQYLKKVAYGVETVELRFNENELLHEFARNGLELVRTVEFHTSRATDEYDLTYVFKKLSTPRLN